LDRLIPLVYAELKALANWRLRRGVPSKTLQATALVHEAYLRLAANRGMLWTDRVHFFAVAARIMRDVLVDHARSQGAAKRGGGVCTLALDEAVALTEEKEVNLLVLDEALTRLSDLDARQARIVELRFFGGLSMEEVADVLHISVSTTKREWILAKTFIRRELVRSAYDP
jgi:RNA polymerase sigma-70 factor (ECF subfamily)